MNRPIQTMLMRKLSGELPLTPRLQQRPQESALQSLHRQHLSTLGNRGKTSDLFCIFHQVQESGLAAAIAWPEDPPKSNEKAAELLALGDELMALDNVFRHDEAVRRYNESLCWAEQGSEVMALGYAARLVSVFMLKIYLIFKLNFIFQSQSLHRKRRVRVCAVQCCPGAQAAQLFAGPARRADHVRDQMPRADRRRQIVRKRALRSPSDAPRAEPTNSVHGQGSRDEARSGLRPMSVSRR